MRKRKPKSAKRLCPHCESPAAPEKARMRTGNKCKRCPDCRGLVL